MLFGLSQKAWIAIGAVVLVGGGAAITGAVVADGDDFDAVPAPQWEAGYNFAYQVTGEADYAVEVPSQGISESPPTQSFGPYNLSKEILSTEYDHNGQPVYVGAATFPIGNILSGSVFDEQDVAAFASADRQYDLSPIPVVPDWDCQSNDCASGGLLFGPDNPFTYLSFPLTPDKRWEQQAELPIDHLFDGTELEELDGLGEVHMVGEVTGMETITLPGDLGETEAVRVDFSYTPVGLQKRIADLREQMEDYGITVERLTVQLGLHEVAHYSPEYQAIVRDEWVIRALVDIAISAEYQGESFQEEGYVEANLHAVADLIGAELVKKPEMEPLQILGKLSGKDPIRDVQGQVRVVKAQDYGIDLSASADKVNAAESELVTFAAELDGVDALPEGHTLSFQVLDATGAGVVGGGGMHDGHGRAYASTEDALLHEFSEPGIYTVYVEALDEDGGLVAQDALSIVAFWEEVRDADCYGVSNIVTYGCEPADVPVRPGISNLVVDVQSSDWEPFFEGRLVLRDAAGQEYYGDYGDDSIEIDDFSDKPLGDWTLVWESNLGVMEEVEYGIFLDYGGFAPATPEEPVGGGDGGNASGGNLASLFRMLGPIDQTLHSAKSGELSGIDAEAIGLKSLLG